MNIRIVLVDDHRLFRTGLLTMLARQTDMEVVGQADDGLEALKLVGTHAPDVVLMDVSMQGMNGVEATRRIRERWPDIRVLCLSMHGDRRFVARVLEAGASGYLLKDCSLEELAGAIRSVVAGDTYLSMSIARTVVADYVTRLGAGDLATTLLTSREREVLQLLSEGGRTSEIAARLHVSAKTVGTHRAHIMKKLGIDNLAGLTRYAIREGLTSTEEVAVGRGPGGRATPFGRPESAFG